jgi:2-polyprenyl-3-methyl-5-hydroxy-6-metoxy-1,4-benzoquinol methylase
MKKLVDRICPVCGSPHLELFFEMLKVPVNCNLLWTEQQAAQNCTKVDIQLAFCSSCGFITNVAFDPTQFDYDQDYENSLHYSPRFQQYAESLAANLVERYNLHDKDIIEIGCGKGDFLISICELGKNRGVGFDPTYVPRAEHQAIASQVQFIQDYYSDRYKDYKADLIVCRHTLEHIPNPVDLLKPLRQAIGDRLDTAIFFEVPNGLDTFRNLAVWDIIYEHCSYFAPPALAQVFAHCGFQVDNIYETFEGQFLCLEALPIDEKIANSTTNIQREEVELLSRDIASFTDKFQTKIETWKHKLTQIAQAGQRAVVWGAGAKGTIFLILLQCQDLIKYIVDINPRKQGMYIAGGGQQIVSPEFLRQYQPDLVIVMNPIYEKEIQQAIADLGCHAQSISV